MSSVLHPELLDLGEEVFLRSMLESRTAIPGHVIGYRPYKGAIPEHAYIRLGISRQLQNGQTVTLPDVDRVPILWPGGSKFTAGTELERGDEVLCIVSDRAIDAWLDGGGVSPPRDARLHDITDIVALPGLTSAKNPVTVKRGSKTYYIGTKSGQAPWIRLETRTTPKVVLEATEIKLGEVATRGVARLNDSTTLSSNPLDPWFVWFTTVGTFVGAPPPFMSPLTTISTASAKAKAE